MRAAELLLSMESLLRENLAGYPFPSPQAREPLGADVRVFVHNVEADREESYPFIIVRWAEGEQEESSPESYCRETVSLVFGVHSPESQRQAGLLCAELMDAVRGILWRNRLLAQRFDLQLPLRAMIPEPERRWHEYHLATLECTYNYHIPSRPLGSGAVPQ